MPEATWNAGGLNIQYSAVIPPDIGPGPMQVGSLTVTTDAMLRAQERKKLPR